MSYKVAAVYQSAQILFGSGAGTNAFPFRMTVTAEQYVGGVLGESIQLPNCIPSMNGRPILFQYGQSRGWAPHPRIVG